MSKLFIKQAAFVATMDDQDREVKGWDILIDGPAIAAMGPSLTPPPEAEVIEAGNMWVFPGLVNTHHHLFQTLTRCIGEVQQLELFPWLKFLYPIWAGLTAEAVAAGTALGLAELLKSGCTTACDHHYLFPRGAGGQLIDVQIEVARQLGIRFHPCRGSMSLGEKDGGLPPDEVVQSDAEILADCERLINSYHEPGPYSMCQLVLAPCSPFSATRELLEQSALLARRHGLRLHTHLAETRDEDAYCRRQLGMGPLNYMEEVGWLNNDVWFAHGIHFTNADIMRLGAVGAGVAHCPTSNQKLSSGAAKVPAMLNRFVPVGLGVDGSASNDGSNMLAEMKTALLLAKFRWGIDSLSARDVLAMATRGGARLLGREDIGCLAPGKAADLFLVREQRLEYAGCHDPVTGLATCGCGPVDMTIVNGRVVVRQGQLVSGDEEKIAAEACGEAGKLLQRAGLT